MIEIREVSKRFAPRPWSTDPVIAIDELSLEIPNASTWAIVGPNGAGKTTLIALILGFLQPSEGTIQICEREPRKYLRERGAAFLPERFTLPPEWPLQTALLSLARLEGLRAAELDRRVDQAIERFGLGAHRAKPIGTLSRGLLQRVGLAQTILAERELVVLDEPTEGLDPIWRIEFRHLIEEFQREERLILIASHDLAEIERIADHAILLDNGRVRESIAIERDEADQTLYYQIDLDRTIPTIQEYFPTARPVDPQAADRATPARYLVTVADHEELSTRLAALLGAGAILESVAPVREALEERVQRALSGGAE